jgi:hypothetical protein
MQDIVIKIGKALTEIEHEKGSFIVKCLVARNPDDIQWDLVLAADWFDADKFRRLSYLTEKILWGVDDEFVTQFSAIITIEPDSDLALFLVKLLSGQYLSHGMINTNGYLIINTDYKLAPVVLPL